eukprot:superscaffoldBa00001457_g10639
MPRISRLIMDDGPPYPHGPGTTDPSSASKRDPVLQSRAQPRCLSVVQPPVKAKPSFADKRRPVFIPKSWLPSLSLRRVVDFSVVLPGWVEKRVHILFIWQNPHIRLPVSAASHTLFPLCFHSAMLESS